VNTFAELQEETFEAFRADFVAANIKVLLTETQVFWDQSAAMANFALETLK
jgi:hypothetical protein